MMRRTLILSALLLLPLSAACDKQGAWGETNSIIIASSPELWGEVMDTVRGALEPRIRTVRDELMFQVTHQEPGGELWPNMRRFRQLLLVGTPDAEWMQDAVGKLRSEPALPSITQVYDVWARDQLVTLLLLPREGDAESVRAMLPQLGELFGEQYHQWAVNRMFLSGVDSAGAETLRNEAGFSLVLPSVYRWRDQDSVYVFRNDNPDPAELIREIVVTWRSPAPETIDADGMLAWRAELAAEHYSYPQLVDLTDAAMGPLEHQGRDGHQVQAVWRNPPEANWPAGGPFILRAIPCPEQDRLYLIDAWLYAPGEQKYEYMIQLETILDSFSCGAAG
jgi:hypothetical protein